MDWSDNEAQAAFRAEVRQLAREGLPAHYRRLTEEGESGLRALVQSVAETETRIQLKAFAAGSAERPSTARRLSLSRALAVRSFLIEQGMRSTRIDVRALGVPADDGPADRVDVILLTQ